MKTCPKCGAARTAFDHSGEECPPFDLYSCGTTVYGTGLTADAEPCLRRQLDTANAKLAEAREALATTELELIHVEDEVRATFYQPDGAMKLYFVAYRNPIHLIRCRAESACSKARALLDRLGE